MAAVVKVYGAYGLAVTERKAETMIMRPPHHALEGASPGKVLATPFYIGKACAASDHLLLAY